MRHLKTEDKIKDGINKMLPIITRHFKEYLSKDNLDKIHNYVDKSLANGNMLKYFIDDYEYVMNGYFNYGDNRLKELKTSITFYGNTMISYYDIKYSIDKFIILLYVRFLNCVFVKESEYDVKRDLALKFIKRLENG